MTASLLARKGEAAPSFVVPIAPVAPVMAPPRPTLVRRREEQSSRSEMQRPDNVEKPRRVMVAITQEELERLNIAAIKTGVTRHDIVRGALDDYFRKLSAELPRPCACMESGPLVPAQDSEV
jgi:hypothetical protein